MYVSTHENNAEALVLAETLQPQYKLQSKYDVIKTIGFHEETVKIGIKLVN